MEMTTPMYWFAFNKITCQQLEAPTFLLKILKKGSFPTQKITHLALLSARVEQNKDGEDLDAPLKDDTLKPHVERADSKPQIVAQLEVLYESDVTWNEADQEGNKREDGARMIVNVATFEACLAGDPNGEMQLRLCDTRQALGFGYGVKEEAMKKHCLNKK
ncbi:LOW QUALITY PROTEIN: hypothetical protein ACHAWO_007028 [Cyclotella atomus]|uniref:Uncharacterized protein n=1 Tax=Cyclotella atomus TaxID=382360 RepID=A0ABD3MRD3_9STRA